MSNLQPLCTDCHTRKTSTVDMAFGRKSVDKSMIPTTVVAGPPGAGKTTYVLERSNPGDLIVDFDALYSALSGLPWYEKPTALMPFVAEARDAVLARLARQSDVRHAWIITSEPDVKKVERLRAQLGAELIVMKTDPLECIRRISNDDRRSDRIAYWQDIVHSWWKAHNTSASRAGEGT